DQYISVSQHSRKPHVSRRHILSSKFRKLLYGFFLYANPYTYRTCCYSSIRSNLCLYLKVLMQRRSLYRWWLQRIDHLCVYNFQKVLLPSNSAFVLHPVILLFRTKLPKTNLLLLNSYCPCQGSLPSDNIEPMRNNSYSSTKVLTSVHIYVHCNCLLPLRNLLLKLPQYNFLTLPVRSPLSNDNLLIPVANYRIVSLLFVDRKQIV